MIPEITFTTETAVLKFYSLADLRRYLKRLLETYEREMDRVSNVIGTLMRDPEIDTENPSTKGWSKVGNLFVNNQDPERGTLDVLFAMTHDIKPKVKHVEETLTRSEQLETLELAEKSTFLLFVKDGVPERLIAIPTDVPEERPDRFVMSATYNTV